ncbi:uncharacterized protein LOC130848115 [Hippopotamus amphibius kiboko]|uniref:uncharacterized protein LOC130848115 n=1 Tax=Hippopotamus amphibius kiboko TaxID=575201 RepID=UPI0025985704|nr:uncharacterized protein LOC130848115 [Hippopotamus amphibius kiboko]
MPGAREAPRRRSEPSHAGAASLRRVCGPPATFFPLPCPGPSWQDGRLHLPATPLSRVEGPREAAERALSGVSGRHGARGPSFREAPQERPAMCPGVQPKGLLCHFLKEDVEASHGGGGGEERVPTAGEGCFHPHTHPSPGAFPSSAPADSGLGIPSRPRAGAPPLGYPVSLKGVLCISPHRASHRPAFKFGSFLAHFPFCGKPRKEPKRTLTAACLQKRIFELDANLNEKMCPVDFVKKKKEDYNEFLRDTAYSFLCVIHFSVN